MAREVLDTIDVLPSDHRDVLFLRDLHGYSTEETADILGITPGATKVRLYRARSTLKNLLKPVMLEGDL